MSRTQNDAVILPATALFTDYRVVRSSVPAADKVIDPNSRIAADKYAARHRGRVAGGPGRLPLLHEHIHWTRWCGRQLVGLRPGRQDQDAVCFFADEQKTVCEQQW